MHQHFEEIMSMLYRYFGEMTLTVLIRGVRNQELAAWHESTAVVLQSAHAHEPNDHIGLGGSHQGNDVFWEIEGGCGTFAFDGIVVPMPAAYVVG
jgi:hypothetical protein